MGYARYAIGSTAESARLCVIVLVSTTPDVGRSTPYPLL